MPSGPVAPVSGRPIVGVVPPPVGVVVPHEVGHLLHVAQLKADVGRLLVVGARVAGFLHAVGHRADDLQGVGVLPVFGPVAVADDEDAVGQVIGVDGGEVRPGVAGGIDQIIPVEIRCRGLFLAGAERDCRECDCRVA